MNNLPLIHLVWKEDKLERYKKHYYAEYYRKELEFEEKYGPSEMIETTFEFSSVDENNSQILGKSKSLILGNGSSGDNENYLYEYWVIIIPFSAEYMVGMFTSLNDVTIALNSLKKYTIYVYHRKSNHQYADLMHLWKTNGTIDSGPAKFDNTFHSCPLYVSMDISSYSTRVNGEIINYETQLEDKEYFGIVEDYVPRKGGIISGNVYTLNPRMIVTISGLTDDVKCKIKEPYLYDKNVVFTRRQNGDYYANEDNSKITKLSDNSFTYLLTKDEIVNTLTLSRINEWKNQISSLNSTACTWFGCDIYDKDDHFIETLYANDGCAIGLYRNNLTDGGTITIPPYGENIDTGFDFTAIDD